MSDFKMARTNGLLLAIMNALVCRLGVGNFVIQMDSGSPARPGGGRKDYWARGYTDTGRAVSGDFYFQWEEGRVPNFTEVRVSFCHGSGEGGSVEVFQEFTCSYSSELGIFVKS